jgi:dipeptidyl aminopeptidase/acylaminoacyl peptidase
MVRTTSFGMKVFLVLAVLLMAARVAMAGDALVDPGGWPIHSELLPHSENRSKVVELFWTKPEGNGPFPAVLFIHGHQETQRNGGEAYVLTGRLGIMARRGYVAAAVSQPGYGNSSGPPDYCGPFTQQATLVAIDFLRRQPFVNPNKVALFGYSRGAIVAAMVATLDPRLAAVVLGAGAYDFFAWRPTLPGISRNLFAEAGRSAEAFTARSAIYHVQQIRAPVLLLHGTADERIPVQQAEAFAEKLKAAGVRYRFKEFPGAPHSIPINDQYREVYPFLDEFLR